MARRRAELPRCQTPKQRIPTRRQRRQNPECPQLAAHQRVPACRQVRHQHRIVRRGNLKMTPGHHEVELVTVEPVPACDKQQGQHHQPRNHPRRRCEPRPIRPWAPAHGRRYDRRHDIDSTSR
jgi:hypothetical protein